jgi:hypothetical protein
MPKRAELIRFDVVRGIESGAKGINRDFKHDKGRGAILGYSVLAKGPLNPGDVRNWEMDEVSLQQVVDLGNNSDIGLKSRFGHPNMSNEALGTFLGRAKNFRRDGDIVRADLFFDETAYKTPKGDLATYVLDLAASDPNAFATSLVTETELEIRLEKDGTPKKDTNGNKMPALVRFKRLYSSDIVDEGAATKGMFSQFFNESVELSAKASIFLDRLLSNPEALEKVTSFFERYRTNRVDIKTEKEPLINLTKEEQMDDVLKALTVEQLSKERPDLFSKITTDAVIGERARALGIIQAEHAEFKGMGMEALSEEAINKGLTLDASLASMRGKRLADLNATKNPAPGADPAEAEVKLDHLGKAKKYQAEHGGTITDALLKTAEPKETK